MRSCVRPGEAMDAQPRSDSPPDRPVTSSRANLRDASKKFEKVRQASQPDRPVTSPRANLRDASKKFEKVREASQPDRPVTSSRTNLREASKKFEKVPEASPPVDDGGCTAVALVALGVWSSIAEAVRALDAQISPLHEKWLRQRGTSDETEAGICGEQWHEEAISNAIKTADWHVRLLSIHPTKPNVVSLRTELMRGRYLVLGVTNNEWLRPDIKGEPILQELKYPSSAADAPRQSTVGWHHAIAIVDGKMQDHDVTVPISSLWLRANNQPDRTRGYMRTIRKVYRIFPCARPGSDCRGTCGKRARE